MRKWIANKLAGLARRIYPESEQVMAFYMDRMVEYCITGESHIKMSYVDVRPDAAPDGLTKEKS